MNMIPVAGGTVAASGQETLPRAGRYVPEENERTLMARIHAAPGVNKKCATIG